MRDNVISIQNAKNVPLNKMENIFIPTKKKICRQRRKTQFSFYQDHQFHKIEDLPHTTQCKIQNVFNWLHHNEMFNFLYYPLLKQWTYIASSFVFFFLFLVLRKISTLFFLLLWILCDMRWNELVPLYVIRALIHITKKINAKSF